MPSAPGSLITDHQGFELPLRLRLNEAARMIGVSPHTLRSWTKRRKIGCFRVGVRLYYSPREIERFIRASEEPPITLADPDNSLLKAAEQQGVPSRTE